MDSKYEAVIGLEVHAQLSTNSKAFCSCSTEFGNSPNSNVCPVCLGHPGVLPVLNKKAVEYTVLMGLATGCRINEHSILARKNYFYPDLPKGYQISQYEKPLCEDGKIIVKDSNDNDKEIRIKRIHIEEDAGKLIHDRGTTSLVDVNRCGIPLMEIVTEPDIASSGEAYQYLSKIKQIVQYLGICDANMEEGSLRCDANISVRIKGASELGTKTEIKNMNSFRNVERALNYEINRQIELLDEGEKIVQETLLWDADLNEAFSMRSKEEAHDYRYFPDPDLIPVLIDEKWKSEIAENLPELPDARKERFINQYSLPVYDAEILTQSKAAADYYETVVSHTSDFKSASNWIMVEVLKIINEEKIDIKDFIVSPLHLASLINLINDGVISSKIAKEVFSLMLPDNKSPELIVKEKNLMQVSDTSQIEAVIQEVLSKNESQINEYLGGKEKVFGFFIGQIMKETKGKANPKAVNDILKEKLESRRK